MIVVGGEALVDLVPDSVSGGSELCALQPKLGGGPYNTAVALGRLGVRTCLLSRISTDTFGRALFQHLVSSGVDTSLVQRGAERTALAVTEPTGDREVAYTFYAHGAADRFLVDPGPLPASTRAVVLGALSLVLDPGAGVYETVMRRESQRGTFIALDPNIRSAVVDDPEAYRGRFERWLPEIDLLKLSAEDARWLAGGSDPWKSARLWAARGPSAVLVTDGSAGMSVVLNTGTQVDVPVQTSGVVDTIGAGDTVQAAVVAWLERNRALSRAAVAAMDEGQWRAALMFAAQAAAVTCSRTGAEPPYLDDLVSTPVRDR
ncbi:carbohydrate kinase family protein [Salinifilum ghardaiensis]